MDTKEKQRETAPRRRPTKQGSQPPVRRPPSKTAGQTAYPRKSVPETAESYEVYVPDAESQRTRHASGADRVDAPARPRSKAAAPAKRRPASGKDAQHEAERHDAHVEDGKLLELGAVREIEDIIEDDDRHDLTLHFRRQRHKHSH